MTCIPGSEKLGIWLQWLPEQNSLWDVVYCLKIICYNEIVTPDDSNRFIEIQCGCNSEVECQPSKLFVVGSIPIARSKFMSVKESGNPQVSKTLRTEFDSLHPRQL